MKQTHYSARLVLALCALLLMGASGVAAAASANQSREKIRQQSQAVLERLYAVKPEAKRVVERSKGYATFSKWGLNLGGLGGGIGRGLAVSLPSGDETFMRFVEGSAGLGLGIKKFDLVFVFETEQARKSFIDQGWTGSAQATMAMTDGNQGKAYDGAISVSPGVWVYQNTEKGLAAELMLKGTKYYKDKSLN